jgi:hypothetical protein
MTGEEKIQLASQVKINSTALNVKGDVLGD